MFAFLTVLHVFICVGLIIVVLLQSGRGAGLASVFGGTGGGGEALFGGRGFGGVLAKATAVLAILFMVTSIALTLTPRTRQARQVTGQGRPQAAQQPPAQQQPSGTQGNQ